MSPKTHRPTAGAQMAGVAALVGDPARANMLALMMDGRSHTATELAAAAAITAATASGHLSKMLNNGLVEVSAQGRHRYYELASQDVARMLESIMVVTGSPAPASQPSPRVPVELREARACYDHLAGRLGVAITNTLLSRGAVTFGHGGGGITESGFALLKALQIDLPTAQGASRRPLCRPCLDWSERQPHLAGVIGKAVLQRLLALHWIERATGSRAVTVTHTGRRGLARVFDYHRPSGETNGR